MANPVTPDGTDPPYPEGEAYVSPPTNGRFTLTINLGNEAMSEPEHIARALEKVAGRVRLELLEGPIIDTNGNTAGFYDIDRSPAGR